jgi:hypothetical protein
MIGSEYVSVVIREDRRKEEKQEGRSRWWRWCEAN